MQNTGGALWWFFSICNRLIKKIQLNYVYCYQLISQPSDLSGLCRDCCSVR